jgi:NSS family neurotransmitter:Na+ symporter
LEFFFKVDFSKITPSVVLSALGQCFLSLSIGMGALITYGAYMQKSQSITITSLQVVILDTVVAVLAGMIIFPAVFAFGVDPQEGPELVFVVLPAIFEKMSFAWFSGIFFFLLLCIAAVTSTISLMEVVVAFLKEASAKTRHPLNRHKSVILVVLMTIAMVAACVFHDQMFDWSDNVTSNILIPLNALAMTIFVGWFLPKADILEEFGKKQRFKYYFALTYLQIVRYLIPLTILIIFLNGLGLWDAIQKLF